MKIRTGWSAIFQMLAPMCCPACVCSKSPYKAEPLDKMEFLWSNDLELLQTSPCSRAFWFWSKGDCCDSCAQASEFAEACTFLKARRFWLHWFSFWNLIAFAPARDELFSGSSKTHWMPFLPSRISLTSPPCLGSDTPLLASITSASWKKIRVQPQL